MFAAVTLIWEVKWCPFGLMVARWSKSTKLLYTGPSYCWDGWLCAC